MPFDWQSPKTQSTPNNSSPRNSTVSSKAGHPARLLRNRKRRTRLSNLSPRPTRLWLRNVRRREPADHESPAVCPVIGGEVVISQKLSLTNYTRAEFRTVVEELLQASGTSAWQDRLLEHFIEIGGHSDGSDHSTTRQTTSRAAPKGIAQIIAWRKSKELLLFKSCNEQICMGVDTASIRLRRWQNPSSA